MRQSKLSWSKKVIVLAAFLGILFYIGCVPATELTILRFDSSQYYYYDYVAPQGLEQATYYVSPEGSDYNDGRSIDTPFRTIQQAADVVKPGDVVYIRGGVYYAMPLFFRQSGTEEAPIVFQSYPGEWAIIDGSNYEPGSESHRVWIRGVSWNIFRNFEVRNSPDMGIYAFEGASYNVFDGIITHHNYGDGLRIQGSHNLVQNVIAHSNYDVKTRGQNADGINIGQNRREESWNYTNNIIRNCLVYNNADDGIDVFGGSYTLIEGNIAYNNGRGVAGNGNGFKLGPGQHDQANNVVRNNIAFDNDSAGFTTNSGTGNVIINNTAWDNGTGFAIYSPSYEKGAKDNNLLRNNLSFSNEVSIKSGTTQSHNSWNLDIENPQFRSTNPNSPEFLSLSANSPAINAGVDVGLPYKGAAPDLGALELGQHIADIDLPAAALASLSREIASLVSSDAVSQASIGNSAF